MPSLKYGFILPFNDGARTVAERAHEAEAAGWDGFFMPEGVWHVDVWVALTAAAMRTERIRLGTMLSPLPRMRPWKLSSETATLDNLSNGRVILSVGVGALFMGYQAFTDEITDTKIRAELLD
ncbi:MAG: LLM class flavin-dependent oxidoreductase [Anaerolineae bacterium]|nr:LLM class flavin-dependent oxidoreductase [Anaerolineae bacterium]